MKNNRSAKMHMLQKLISFILIASTFLSVVFSARQLPSQEDPQKSDSIACGRLDEPSIHATLTFGFIAMTAGDVQQSYSEFPIPSRTLTSEHLPFRISLGYEICPLGIQSSTLSEIEFISPINFFSYPSV
ncbi:hypothetical protein KP509_24G012600 [Ceratopteris richardii]|uniref:Uncharacterized protein n=1 Tax=Ceratopteris richardii TaxID=49495 RepID=A0A8T2RVK1_CERRI|nr:hypothetical protein KP509_24G012600 [Ceratopteris richardii]